jgi:hypothetical protein
MPAAAKTMQHIFIDDHLSLAWGEVARRAQSRDWRFWLEEGENLLDTGTLPSPRFVSAWYAISLDVAGENIADIETSTNSVWV